MNRARIVTWEDPAATATRMREMTGLEALRAMLAGTLPPPPMITLLGIVMERIEPGLVVMTLPVGEHLYNPAATVHGGASATLLDSAMGCAVQSSLASHRVYTTLELKLSYIRPITMETGTITATGRVINAGRRAAFAEGSITDAAGKILVTASTTCAIWEI
jgi:uncharacterized protein (TIGR00369 family)